MNPCTDRRSWDFLPLVAVGLILTGCSPPVEPEPDPDPVASSIVLESDRVEVDDGAEVSMTAQVLDQNGTPLTPQPGLTWTSSDEGVASVTAAGLLRGEFPGEAVVAASLGELRAEAEVTVRPFATGVEPVSGTEQRAGPGAALAEPIVVRVLDRHENPVAGAEVEFAVSAGGGTVSPSLASVDEHGEARAEWTLGTSSEVNRAVARLMEGVAAEAAFSATVVTAESVPEGGGEVETSGGEVKLSFPANALPAETEVSVEPAEPVQETPANATRVEGTAYRFEPSGITFSEPVEIQISYAGVELPAGVSQADLRIFRESDSGWQMIGTSHPDLTDQVVRAEIHGFSTYSIMAVSASSVTVRVPAPTAHVQQLRLTVTASDVLTPIEADLAIDSTGASASVEVPAGSGRTVTVRGYDAGGTVTQRGDTTVSVVAGESLDLSVAMEGLDGSVTVAIGFEGYTLSLETGGAALAVGATRPLTATVRDPDGDTIEDAQFTWASANPALARVDTEGNVTAISAGETRISVTYKGFAVSAPLTIEP